MAQKCNRSPKSKSVAHRHNDQRSLCNLLVAADHCIGIGATANLADAVCPDVGQNVDVLNVAAPQNGHRRIIVIGASAIAAHPSFLLQDCDQHQHMSEAGGAFAEAFRASIPPPSTNTTTRGYTHKN
mmetsp:Transcript_15658/g.32932  ORF Transcript_15658/g.32932 Transcript_15658/m.32932 type:complete len:127 (+) Transcript_15658:40-420(+)